MTSVDAMSDPYQSNPQPSAAELERARELLAKLPTTYQPCSICGETREWEQYERESHALDTTNATTLALALREREREALERAAADWLELLKSVHKPHPQEELCRACVSILQRRPVGDRSVDRAEAESK
jgi:hypothetical protein